MKIKAMVAVRAGSVRVPAKNTRPFSGTTLLESKLVQLKRLRVLDSVIVNSDDPLALSIAAELDCETVTRDPYYATSTVSMSDVYAHMATQCDADVIVYANCTSPLIRDATIERLIAEFVRRDNRFDSLNTGSLIKEFLFRDNRPINYNLAAQPRSQDLPDIIALNFAINVLTRETMIKCRNVVGRTPRLRIIDDVESVDIDTPLDFWIAERLYEERGGHGFLMS
ncbi:cytidylyltransferase domain-containing protein [Lentzea sp. NPDC060358]|uniref:acylneuraminate cytidylyltransferase family protein n=1 Tax=Lentzea sp. NPDC060358 TaxID=3347103 RepID=UPI003666DD15